MTDRYHVVPDPKYSQISHLIRTEKDGGVELGEDVWFTPAEAEICAFALNAVAEGRVLVAERKHFACDCTSKIREYDGPTNL